MTPPSWTRPRGRIGGGSAPSAPPSGVALARPGRAHTPSVRLRTWLCVRAPVRARAVACARPAPTRPKWWVGGSPFHPRLARPRSLPFWSLPPALGRDWRESPSGGKVGSVAAPAPDGVLVLPFIA